MTDLLMACMTTVGVSVRGGSRALRPVDHATSRRIRRDRSGLSGRRRARRTNPNAPLKRKHIGTLAALVTEPLYLAHASQPGTEMYLDPTRGNLAMHAAMRAAMLAVPLPIPPRALPVPVINYRGLARLAPETSASVEQALENLSEATGR